MLFARRLTVALVVLYAALAPAQELAAPFNGAVNYPRARTVDHDHLRIEVEQLNWEEQSVVGRTTHFFKALNDDVKMITLDAIDMTVLATTDGRNGAELTHRVFDDRVEVDLPKPLAVGELGIVQVRYKAYPKKGLYFVSPDPNYPDRPQQAWTQGEPHESRHWYPCFDSPMERVSSEVIATVRYPLQVISNGILKQVKEHDHGDHVDRTYHWVFEAKHVNYLITMVVGVYEKIEETWEGIPIVGYHYPGDRDRAELSYFLTSDMMEFFSARFGRYPYDLYQQVVVRDFHWGGMENTTATTLTDRTLHTENDEPNTSSHDLVAHELAHQWFGNLVTCRDWAHIWLNESFATFCETIYAEAAFGQDEAQMRRLGQARSYFREDKNDYRRPLCCNTYTDPNNMFDSHSYPKGARIIEMLRKKLGEETLYRGLKQYLRKFRNQSVETEQLRVQLEEVTGVALARFFDQWIYRGGHPELRVRQEYDSTRKTLTLDVEQTQAVNRLTPMYHLDAEVAIFLPEAEGPQIEAVSISRKKHSFTFNVSERPTFVRFDRTGTLLMKLDHRKATREWIAQLTSDPDVLGRVFAAEELGRKLRVTGDRTSGEALVAALQREQFWGVRNEIAKALGKGGGEDSARALERLLSSDSDSRVRATAADSLGALRLQSAAPALATAFRGDPNDWVRKAALGGHYKVDGKATVPLALEGLGIASHRGRVRKQAMDVLEDEEHTDAIDRILELAKPGAPRAARTHALEVVGRMGKGNDKVRAALLAQIDDPHNWTRQFVFQALGHIGGADVKAALEQRRESVKRDYLKKALEEAIERINKPDSVEKLSEEVERLKRRVREMEKKQ
ncbi:MAG: M1 family aminopeptidase [Planctomycetota bacterium]